MSYRAAESIVMICEETNTAEDQTKLKDWDLRVPFTPPRAVPWQQSNRWTIPKLYQGAAKAGSSEKDITR